MSKHGSALRRAVRDHVAEMKARTGFDVLRIRTSFGDGDTADHAVLMALLVTQLEGKLNVTGDFTIIGYVLFDYAEVVDSVCTANCAYTVVLYDEKGVVGFYMGGKVISLVLAYQAQLALGQEPFPHRVIIEPTDCNCNACDGVDVALPRINIGTFGGLN